MNRKIKDILENLNEDSDEDWMSDAVKKEGKLRNDLDVPEDKKIYEIDPQKLIDYAKKSTDNQRRVQLAMTFAKEREGGMSEEERKFWDKVEKGLEEDE